MGAAVTRRAATEGMESDGHLPAAEVAVILRSVKAVPRTATWADAAVVPIWIDQQLT